MLGKSPDPDQRNLFKPHLTDFIDMHHELVLLSDKIGWIKLERSLSGFYSNTGQPSKPIGFMVGCLLLKRLYNLGDESLAQAWEMNPYMQYFTGEACFSYTFPCSTSDFVHFRKRMGTKGMEIIFTHTVDLHGSQAKSKQVLSDTTVQENHVTYPTEAKLYKKIIDKCSKIAQQEGIKQRQSYSRKSKQWVRDSYNGHHPKRKKKAKASERKLKTVCGRLLRELERKLPACVLATYQEELSLYSRVLHQRLKDKDKIYSLHKPFTCCIAKGKAGKKYEYGNKIGLMLNPKNLVLLGINSFMGNPHDSKTIEPLLDQLEKNLSYQPQEVVYDRAGRGKTKINGVKIATPRPALKTDSAYQKRKKRQKFRRRAAIEPVIGHLKKEFRMAQNYLSGNNSPQINALLAASGWNLKKLMGNLKRDFLFLIFQWEIWKIYPRVINYERKNFA